MRLHESIYQSGVANQATGVQGCILQARHNLVHWTIQATVFTTFKMFIWQKPMPAADLGDVRSYIRENFDTSAGRRLEQPLPCMTPPFVLDADWSLHEAAIPRLRSCMLLRYVLV